MTDEKRLVPAHSKMGVIKKLKRAFSFKKDKKNGKKDGKDAAKNGASNTLPANGSLERGSSDVDVVKTDTLQKEHKKRSWSLRSIARKPSFGKKDKDKKKDKDVSGQSSHDTTLEPALLSGVIAPAAATTEQQTSPTPLEPSQAATTTATMESSDTSAPPLPDTEPPTAETAAEAERATEPVTEENSAAPVLDDGETKPDDDFEVVTPEIVKDLEEYEARLAAEGRAVRVNETADSDVAKKDEAETEQPAKADPEPHTISDVINLLSEKSDPSPVDATDCKSATANAEPKCPVQPTAAVEDPIIPTANGTKPTTAIPTPKTNGSSNGHILTNMNGPTCPALGVKPTSAQVYKPAATGPLTKQSPSSSVSRWRGWLAALVVIAALAALAVFGVSEPTRRSAIRTD